MVKNRTGISTPTDWVGVERAQREKHHTKEIRDTEGLLRKATEAAVDLRAQLDVALAIKGTPVENIPIVRAKNTASEAVAFAVLSDWHVEETIEPHTVNGLNEYNLEIASERIDKVFSGILRLTEIQRHGVDIDTLVLGFLGDHMSGFLHEELAEENALSPMETVLWLKNKIAAGINLVRREGNFKRIIIPTCYGNHSRTTKKPRHGSGAKHSYEWLLYSVLSQEITDGVEWKVGNSYFNFLNVYDQTIRLHHGDDLKYQGGVGGLTIPVEKAIAQWNKAKRADIDIFGHWHQFQTARHWVCNSSLIGYNAYALAIKASFEVPSQTYFLMDKDRGRTITAPIFG